MTLTQRLFAPGWYRAALGASLGFALGMGIVVVVRSLYGWDPILNWDAIITVGGLIAAPLGGYAAKRVPARGLMIMVGVVLTLTSAWGIWRAFA